MKIFLIGGKAGSGKNTFGDYLKSELEANGYKPCIMQFSTPLYEYARKYFDWNENIDPKPREFLQKMGIEIIKEKLHKDLFLIDRLCDDISILNEFFDAFIVTDTRLLKEFLEMKKRYNDVVTIHLKRNNYENNLTLEEKQHITEQEVDIYQDYDYTIINDNINTLKNNAHIIIQKEIGRN